MRRTVATALSVAVVFCFGSLLSFFEEATQAQQADDNKAVCDIETTCLTSIVCDEDTGEVDADGDLIALRDSTGAKKKAVRKKAAKKKARRKKATTKKARKRKAETYTFNTKTGDEIRDMLSDDELDSLLAELVGTGGFFDGTFPEPVCGDGVVESPEVCEPPAADTCGLTAFCNEDCSACVSIPQ